MEFNVARLILGERGRHHGRFTPSPVVLTDLEAESVEGKGDWLRLVRGPFMFLKAGQSIYNGADDYAQKCAEQEE